MDKMTSGEIAKKAGISQKAVRLYDEKGLLKPSEYSEGNYRLYDKEALLVLENIIALKQIGFSLEEIRDNLVSAKNMDIAQSLQQQLEIMEQRKAEIDRTINCIRGVLARTQGQPDWNTVAEIARMIQRDQGADIRHWHAQKHQKDTKDWYVKIYEMFQFEEGAKVLDLGCGYAKLWRNNWKDIPRNMKVDAVDLHGSWADDFASYLDTHKQELPEGTDITLLWADVEEADSWERLQLPKGTYSHVIAHYLLGFLKDEELLVQRAAGVLAEGGMLSVNGYCVSCVHDFWKQTLEEIGLDTRFITTTAEECKKAQNDFVKMLENYFGKVESVELLNHMGYEDSEEVFERLCSMYPKHKKYLLEKKQKITVYFDKLIKEQGEIVLTTNSQFWHCYK